MSKGIVVKILRINALLVVALLAAACSGGGGGGGGAAVNQNPPAPVNVSINDASVAEGDAGQADLSFTVSLSAAAAAAVTVEFTTNAVSAAGGTDYTATNGTLTFAPGVTSQSITVSVVGDTDPEADETLNVVSRGTTCRASYAPVDVRPY